MDYIDKLPEGNSVCHDDVHVGNIVVSSNELIPIDWANANKGNPLGDVARTLLIISSPGLFPGIPQIMATLSQCPKR